MSASGRAGGEGGRADRRAGGQEGGRSSSSRPGLTVRLCRRCWCRSWSSTRSVTRPRVPVPASPSRPASPAAVVTRTPFPCLFPAVAEEVGLGGQRAQQELRGIGEHRPSSRVPRALARPRPRPGLRSRAGAAGPLPGGSRWPGSSGRLARPPPPTPEGSRWGLGADLAENGPGGGAGRGRGRPWLAARLGLQVRRQPLRGALSAPCVPTCNSSSHWSLLPGPAQVSGPLVP